ncbi:hypothetical protein BDW69DRAFT_81859 [Aspergillus filifer]
MLLDYRLYSCSFLFPLLTFCCISILFININLNLISWILIHLSSPDYTKAMAYIVARKAGSPPNSPLRVYCT